MSDQILAPVSSELVGIYSAASACSAAVDLKPTNKFPTSSGCPGASGNVAGDCASSGRGSPGADGEAFATLAPAAVVALTQAAKF